MFDVHLGVVNYLLALAGLSPQKWLHDPVMAMPVIVLYGLWHGVGYTMMIFLAGLQAIPSDLYEAAMVDGADRRASFRHITLPLLRPVTLFVLITSVIASFKVFDAVYVMTRGGPGYATMPMVQYIYMTAFEAFDMGYASALAMVLFAIVLVLTVVQLRVFGAEAES
jgi:multiple sugar transport system permease protein